MITVLVVDDDFRVARIHSAFVDKVPGFRTVGVAHSGAAALTCGPAAAGALLGALGPGALVWTPTVADAAGSGDLGMTVGTATASAAPESAAPASAGGDVSYSKYLTVWRRGRDGVALAAARVPGGPEPA